MKRRKLAWLTLLLVVAAAGLLRYAWSVQTATSKRIIVERDGSNASSVKPAPTKSGFDPYFVQVNHSAATTLFGTNTPTRTP
jgi:hypothetical protein